jgi:hypothetical protein
MQFYSGPLMHLLSGVDRPQLAQDRVNPLDRHQVVIVVRITHYSPRL